eukprot:6181940-Pleurochrysis_carterae.AAC.1
MTTGHVAIPSRAPRTRTTATPTCERTGKKFSGGTRDAVTDMERAVRAALRAAGEATDNTSMRPLVVRWAALSLAEWKKQGALSVFHTR